MNFIIVFTIVPNYFTKHCKLSMVALILNNKKKKKNIRTIYKLIIRVYIIYNVIYKYMFINFFLQ